MIYCVSPVLTDEYNRTVKLSCLRKRLIGNIIKFMDIFVFYVSSFTNYSKFD